MGLLAFWPSFGQYWPQYQRFAEHCSAHPCVFPAEIVGATYNLHFFFTTLILIPSLISTYRFTTDSKKDFLKIVIMCFIIQLPNWVVGNFSFRSDNIFSNGVDHNKIYILPCSIGHIRLVCAGGHFNPSVHERQAFQLISKDVSHTRRTESAYLIPASAKSASVLASKVVPPVTIALAMSLPSSTPNWSNELICSITPLAKVRCS